MSTASSRVLMRLLGATFLLLLGSDANGHARITAHKHHSSHAVVAAANDRALLAATVVPNPKDVYTARPDLLASEARLYDRRAQSTPAPTRDFLSLCSYERTISEAARPPPFQA
jgi:hypothetical protein